MFLNYESKPVVIKAERWDGSVKQATNIIDHILSFNGTARYHEESLGEEVCIAIDTLEGTMKAHQGDWIIQGTEDEFYPCKNSVFNKKYTLGNPVKA